ncbi:hypothetical protein CVT25_015763 [Psilocybe cyanescens]|uniref:SUI1 domain-containing protein n=1 Tax=Psilocybe cyanescens TaxID=93625 RepID=A0A409WRY8_PSICY|nr:hypothetical protein CVT25_015763 [Psilocybe cyanescens]
MTDTLGNCRNGFRYPLLVSYPHLRSNKPTFRHLSIHRMSVQNLNSYDPFADEGDPLGDSADVGSTADYIHIRIQQRNGRKTLTTLQGLPKRAFASPLPEFACNGTLVDDEKMGQVIQLQGDQRAKISAFLVENGLEKSTIKVHGF